MFDPLVLQACYQSAPPHQYYARKSPAEPSWSWQPQEISPQTFSSMAGTEKEAVAGVTGEEAAGWEELILSTLEPPGAQSDLSQDLAQFISDHNSQLQHPAEHQLFFLPEQENSFAMSF